MVDIESLLAKTDAFLQTMHVARDSFGLLPDKEHIGTCINYVDLVEMRAKFVEELTSTIVTYVYAPNRQQELMRELIEEGRDTAAAARKLYRRAQSKFRPSSLQGQFSELLLCNLLQHYFKAVPIVRKMAITTNPSMERNGADAIHIGVHDGTYRLYVGEAKTYNRAGGTLHAALKDAVTDIVQKHYRNHLEELDLYTYEDFVPAELEQISRDYLRGTLISAEVHLVCIVTYDIGRKVDGQDRAAKLASTISALAEDAKAVKCDKILSGVPKELLPRLNYIIFPVQEMDDLIESFKKELRN